ncbi:MAG: RNA-directed DNA polymerase [Paludibacteraceae bacterium]|nr:RNA-directed DNA polymerase [Paludibacteraceae bacterium]
MNFCFPDKMITNCENNILENERNLKISLKEHFEPIENIEEQGVSNKDNTKSLSIDKLIKEHIFKTDSPNKLAWLISKIMKEVISENYFVTEKQLKYLSTPKVSNRYKTFKIKKKSGGTREINAPTNRLNNILYSLNLIFKSLYSPHEAVCGFTEGRSIRDNALRHVGHHYVFNIDLKDFFTSIPQARIWARIQCAPFNFSPSVANVVAGLCCVYNEELGKNVLPQGAPTSPLLTNAICDKMDRKLAALAKKYGLHYSRYADDITFSSMHNVYQEESEFRKEMKNIIEGQGFCLNDKKTRLLKSGQRQEVTGLTVNSKVNVTRKYVKDLRCLLHIWETKGYNTAYSYFYPLYKKEKGHIKKGEPVMENVIGGKLNYLRMIKGESNACYQKLQQRYDKLQKIIYIDNNIDKDITFVYQQFVLQDFEKNFSTKISLQISPKEKLIGKCNIFGMEKMLSITLNTQKELCPNLNTLNVGDTVNSPILKDCYVSLCCQRGRNFWLISHKQLEGSKYLTIPYIKINPDILLKKWEETNLEYVAWKFYFAISNKIDISTLENSIQEFVYFVTHNKHFNNTQKLQVAKLLARDYQKSCEEQNDKLIYSQENKNNEGKIIEQQKIFDPIDTARFLSLFNEPTGLKYLTHDFDPDNCPKTINELIEQTENVLKTKKRIPESLYALIENFSFGKKEWLDTFGKSHSSSIDKTDWIEWSENFHSHPINNPNFRNEIEIFRGTVRIDKGLLSKIIDVAAQNTALKIEKEKIDTADFYTNTYLLYLSIKRIFEMMNHRTEFPNVFVSYKRGHDENGAMLRKIIISQKGSFPQKTLQESIDRLNNHKEAGDFGAIKKYLNGYCFWSVETRWEGKSSRWNILRNANTPETEELDLESDGFTHILTFYLV